MRHTLLALIIGLLFLPAVLHGGEAHPWDNKRIYYIIEFQGRLREKGFFVRRPGSYQKRPCIITEEEKSSFAEYDSQTLVRSVRSKTIVSLRGEALLRQEETISGDFGRESVSVQNGEADFTASGYYGGNAKIPVPAGVLFEVSGEWLASHDPRPGKSFPINVISRDDRQVTTEQVTIRQRVPNPAGKGPDMWLAEFNSEWRTPMFARFTSDGRLLGLESDELIYQIVSREDYDQGKIPGTTRPPSEPVYDTIPATPFYQTMDSPSSIVISETVPAWDNFAWLVLHGSPASEWHDALTASEYSRVEYAGAFATITATRNAPRADASAAFPMTVPAEVQPDLSSSPLIPSQHPAIIEAARTAVADSATRRGEPNVLRAISYLAGWINQNVGVEDWRPGGAPVLDTLNLKSGDSAGHARLYAAMARSLGIPTRICQGLLVQTGRAIYHCWAESWINGEWIPVDTTVSRVGLPAGYILAERSDAQGAFQRDFAAFLKTPGLTLGLASAGRETPGNNLAELVVADRRTYAVSEGDWLANLYWGFAFRLPPEWTGMAKLNSVEILSPDRQANVKCEALSGDFKAGRPDLDAAIADLRSRFARFRLVDSRIVAFDSEGATPALFIDFTCAEGGETLRCRQYLLPRRHRAFRVSFWAPAGQFPSYAPAFDSILASFEY